MCVNDNAFKEFHKATHIEVNIIISTYNTVSVCLSDFITRLDYYNILD